MCSWPRLCARVISPASCCLSPAAWVPFRQRWISSRGWALLGCARREGLGEASPHSELETDMTVVERISGSRTLDLPNEAGDVNAPRFEPIDDWLRGAEPELQKT